MACPSCGGRVQEDARYCQHCGKALSGDRLLNTQTLTVIAAALIVLVAMGLLFASAIDFDRLSGQETTDVAPPPQTVSGQPPDLSTMSPRVAADRLFNRVMMAEEQGNIAEIEQFAPMAVAAYEQLESLDADALFHLGLIHAAAGNIEDTKDFAKRMKAIVPTHLLTVLLEHRIAMTENDMAAAASADDRFREYYDEEMSIGRLEYEHHVASIERFRARVMDDAPQ